jgi:hypothetical protein
MRDLKQELDDIKIQRAGLWNKIKELEAEKKEAEKQASHWRRRCYNFKKIIQKKIDTIKYEEFDDTDDE